MFKKTKKIFKDCNDVKQCCCDFDIKAIEGQENGKDQKGNKSCCSMEFVDIDKNEKENDKKKEIVRERYTRIIKDKSRYSKG